MLASFFWEECPRADCIKDSQSGLFNRGAILVLFYRNSYQNPEILFWEWVGNERKRGFVMMVWGGNLTSHLERVKNNGY
jgi:hypothetical protein